MLTPSRPPPEDYYQNNWRTLLCFVVERYGHLLDGRHHRLLTDLLALSDDAQRLCARILTRKAHPLRETTLAYAEVLRPEQALAELAALGVITRNGDVPADRLLKLLRKDELVETFPSLDPRLRKEDMCRVLLSRVAEERLKHAISARHRWVCVAEPALWHLVKLLYFGDAGHDWSAFVIRDLGMVRYEEVALTSQRFASASDIADEITCRQLAALSRRLDEHPMLGPELVTHLQKPRRDRFSEARRRRALLRIGQWYERNKETAVAVAAYELAEVHPARERIVRSLHKAGQHERAEAWLQRIRCQPQSDDERQFAARFGKRGAGYQPPVTEIPIPAVRPDVEQQALELLLEEGQWGAHVENSLMRTLTGLLYWPALFADVTGAFTNPFQFAPNDLYRDDFAANRHAAIKDIEAMSDAQATRALLTTAQEKHGIANTLVNWALIDSLGLDAILRAMPIADVRRVAAFLIRNLQTRRSGLPDLFIARGPGDYELVEVKGPTDQLQPGQRVWLRRLAELEIPARVVKLRLAE